MRERFEEIYATNEWGVGSGEGLIYRNAKGYAKFLEKFLRRHNIKSVVDLGCGDWQFSQFINWQEARYQGFDIVRPIIKVNRTQFSSSDIEFYTYSGEPVALPGGDLLIAKDVLQHWSNDFIQTFFLEAHRYKYVLVTNCINPAGITINSDIKNSDFRYLDIRLSPFNMAAKEVYSFAERQGLIQRCKFERPKWIKKTLLLQNLIKAEIF
jgi:2-polyprenyl-3-methyl-5-hydroxy-6-metoxy-1,4-benzoquinol methylase